MAIVELPHRRNVHPIGRRPAAPEGSRPPRESAPLPIRCSTAIWSTSGPAKTGGDYAESFALPDGSTAIGVWDASGSGAAASSNMIVVRAGLRTAMGMNAGVVGTARALNRTLFDSAASDGMPWPFVAGFFAMVDHARGTMKYVSCGHEAAILFGHGRHRHLSHNSPLLGINAESDFFEDEIGVRPGDVLVVVTDGITEARALSSETDFFGTGRLCSLFQPPYDRAEVAASSVLSHAVAFSDGRLDDDAAVLVACLA